MNRLVTIILLAITSLAMLMQGAADQDVQRNALELKRLETLIELAEVNRDCSRIEGSLAALDEGKFDSASDKTLQHLTLQLNAAKKTLSDLRSVAQLSSDETKKRIDFAESRVAVLSAKVRLAETSLRDYFKQELAEAHSDKNRLKARIKEIQGELDRTVPVVEHLSASAKTGSAPPGRDTAPSPGRPEDKNPPGVATEAVIRTPVESPLRLPSAGQVCVSPPAGVVAWWPLDEAAGSTFNDVAGAHTITRFGTPKVAAGKVGSALRFSGSSDFLGAARSDDWAFGNGDFTIELWANFASPGGGSVGRPSHVFIGNDEGPGNRNKWFFALGGGFLYFHIASLPGAGRFFPQVPFSPVLNEWYHLAITKNGATYTIYIDGTPGPSVNFAAPVPQANAPLTIGQAESLGFMNGLLDEITVYNRALSPQELQSIVIAGGAGKCRQPQPLQSQTNITPSAGLSPKPPAPMMNPKDGLRYVWIPPGSFMMGCSEGDAECYDVEKPPHAERIANGFWLSQTLVTQAAYRRVIGSNPSHFMGDQMPVEEVSWNDAVNYCRAVGGRLPTETEWEYAARAGSARARYGDLDAIAWYNLNSGNTTHPVALKQPNAFGLFDMLGNAWEWVEDYAGTSRRVRGGSWYNVYPRYPRASLRGDAEQVFRNNGLGFRCVWEFRPPEAAEAKEKIPPTAVAPEPEPHAPVMNAKDGLRYIWIPPGSFMMGCSEGDTECYPTEKPQNEMIANGFWLSQTPVTQTAYRRVTGNNPSHFRGDQLPVETVSWDEAVNYCRSIGGRLPTGAEWEYAARAGSTSARYGDLNAIAWYGDNSGGTTHPVALKKPNTFGLYDMLGNVWEWVEDTYPGTSNKTVGGGSQMAGPRSMRGSMRWGFAPSLRSLSGGFRCVAGFVPPGLAHAQ